MRIAVIGVDFPLGKRNLADERLEKLRNIFHVAKVTEIQIEFVDESQIKDAQAILCASQSKLDLILEDLEIIENRLASGEENKELFLRAKDALEKETPLNEITLNEEERKILCGLNLVTLKPATFVDKENLLPQPEMANKVFADCGLIAFFTANERELRAWPIKSGASIYEAAGSIHSDIQRGFIKAEVINYKDLIKVGSLTQAKAQGLVKLEDKGYIVKDGDFIQIRFNV